LMEVQTNALRAEPLGHPAYSRATMDFRFQ
jgi:hypothetical protein